MEVDWEKEGAESWALPDYGPPQAQSLDPDTLRDEDDEYYDDFDSTYDPDSYEEDGYHSDPLSSGTNLLPPPATAHSASPKSSVRGPEAWVGNNRALQRVRTNTNSAPRGGFSASGEPLFKVGHYGGPKGRSGPSVRGRSHESRAQRDVTRSSRNRVHGSNSDDFARAKWRTGKAPDATFRLPCEYRVFQSRIAQTPEGTLSHADFCQQLKLETGAYVRIGVRNPKLIEIWGREGQVLGAQRMAQHYVNEISQPSRSDKSKVWTKINAHSNVKVASQKVKEYNHARVEALRKAPTTPTYCMYIFLWPEEGPSLRHCLVTHHQQLDDMRVLHDVHLYTNTNNLESIFLSGRYEQSLYQVAEKLRDLWHSLYVQCKTEIKLFLVAPPAASVMRTGIIMDRVEDFSKAFLYGDKLPREQALAWGPKAQGFKEGNKKVIQRNLEKALELVLNMSGGFQLRAKFGSFFLDEFKKPGTGNTYSFEEFRDMLRNDNVKGRLLPGISLPQETIFERIMDAHDLLAPSAGVPLKSLMSIKPRHSASFDYRVAGDAIIRVEVSFTQPPGISEFEANEARAFKPRKKGTGEMMKPMQISMIDFERADWQLDVKAFALYQGEEFRSELEAFKRSIRYKWNLSVSSIGSIPKRKTEFIRGVPVCRFVEKSAVQLSVIDTPYVFEIARYDEYRCVNRGEWMDAKVSWGATLFNPDWDDFLTEKAEKVERDEFSESVCLSTFFPAPKDVIDKAMADWAANEAKEAEDEVKKEAEDEAAKKAELEARRAEAEIRIRKHHETEQLKTFMSKVQTLARMLGSPEPEMGEVLDMDIGTLF